MNTVPVMRPFQVANWQNIEKAKIWISTSPLCEECLTTENFGTAASTAKKTFGGFYDMEKDFTSEEGVKAIEKLAKETGRRFRLGTPLEALEYHSTGEWKPDWWVVLGKVALRRVLAWQGWRIDPGFDLLAWEGKWLARNWIFIVEDVD